MSACTLAGSVVLVVDIAAFAVPDRDSKLQKARVLAARLLHLLWLLHGSRLGWCFYFIDSRHAVLRWTRQPDDDAATESAWHCWMMPTSPPPSCKSLTCHRADRGLCRAGCLAKDVRSAYSGALHAVHCATGTVD